MEALDQWLMLESSILNLPWSEEKDVWTYIYGTEPLIPPQRHISTWWDRTGFIQFLNGYGDHLVSINTNYAASILSLCSLQWWLRGNGGEHLFLHCQFARSCWNLVGIQVPNELEPLEALESFKSQLRFSFFIEIIVLMCWSIWSSELWEIVTFSEMKQLR